MRPPRRRRRHVPAVAAAALVLIQLAATPASTAPTPQPPTRATPPLDRPNIVVILTDDQRWDTLWAMPTVQRELVGRGVRFDEAFVVNPLCCPSRVSFLTGQYSHTSGVYSNRPPDGGFDAFVRDGSTLATWLHDAGYRTALVGKYLNQYGATDETYIPPGWDRWVAFTGAGPGYLDYDLNVDGVVEHHGAADEDYSTDVLAEHAEAFVRDAPPGRSVFLWMTPFAPHGGAIPATRHATAFGGLEPARPPSFDEVDVSDKPPYIRNLEPLGPTVEAGIDELRRDQYRTLLAVDEAVGRMIDALADTGRLENTIIVFASDNGFSWGEHRWRYKVAPYEENIRVPMVIRWDRYTSEPWVERRITLNIDVAPTLADAAGVRAVGADGSSLLPILKGAASGGRAEFLVESTGLIRRGKGIAMPSYCAVRTRDRLFVHYADDEEEFYRLGVDPFQLRNRVSQPSSEATVDRLRSRARALCDPLPPGMSPF